MLACQLDAAIGKIDTQDGNPLVEEVLANMSGRTAARVTDQRIFSEGKGKTIQKLSVIFLLVHFILEQLVIFLSRQVIGLMGLGIDDFYRVHSIFESAIPAFAAEVVDKA